VLGRFAPIVEGASIDEWYLDMGGTEGVYHHEPLAATAERIRAAVLDATGLTLSIGGGTNKLIAKMAAARAKPDGVVIVDAGLEEAFLRSCTLAEIPLRGFHNVMNVLAACAAAGAAGVPVSAMREAILSFKPVPHRLETVAVIDGVAYINDSIATAPERVVAAINAFPDEPLVLLLGGRDKNLPWDDLLRLALTRSRAIITFGEAGLMIATEAARLRRETGIATPIEQASTLKDAVRQASLVAQEGDIVLLSPGATSYDAYQDFEARGEDFRRLVKGL